MRVEAGNAGSFRRRLALTPLIDVIFLLLLFFMLSSTFQRPGEIAVNGGDAGAASAAALPDVLVRVEAGGALDLNGEAVAAGDGAARLAALYESGARTAAVSTGREASVADLTATLDLLAGAGFTQVHVVRRGGAE